MSLPSLLIGCPVYERGWILERWFDSFETWDETFDLSFAFIYTPSGDDTLNIINRRAPQATVETVTEGTHSTLRNWGDKDRLETMAALRNKLIDVARDQQPDWLFSIDSDILAPPIGESVALFEDNDYSAVAPLVYLGNGDISNAFTQRGPRVIRRRIKRFYDALQPADIICAAKLIKPDLFNDTRVSYGYHGAGEDIYWSNAATAVGHRFGFDTRVTCKHIMKRTDIDTVDPRVGW